jgi:hypothetical protein
MHVHNDFRDLSKWIKRIGLLLILLGVAAAAIAPLEIYTFYLFSEGGKFHYEGFGFGSFMFGNITIQVIGYYAIAFLCILLGYGHLRLQQWSRKVTLTLLWDWMIFGFPLSIIFFLMLVTSKDPDPNALPFLLIGFFLMYPIMPILFIKFYRHRNIQYSFQEQSPGWEWIDQLSEPTLILTSLVISIILALQVPLLFNGIFPLFGRFAFELEGFLLLDLSILFLGCMLWGIVRLKKWAWWGNLIYLLLMLISATTTFLSVDPTSILEDLKLPAFEMEIFKNVPLQGYHFALMLGLPLLITLIFQIASRKDYSMDDLKDNSPLPDPSITA